MATMKVSKCDAVCVCSRQAHLLVVSALDSFEIEFQFTLIQPTTARSLFHSNCEQSQIYASGGALEYDLQVVV